MEVDSKEDKTQDKKSDTKTPDDKKTPDKDAKPGIPISERARLIKRCLDALGLCLSRFPQHYKSLYRLAHAFSTLESLKVSVSILDFEHLGKQVFLITSIFGRYE